MKRMKKRFFLVAFVLGILLLVCVPFLQAQKNLPEKIGPPIHDSRPIS